MTRHRAPAFEPTYQFTPRASKNCAFAWITGEPTAFSSDRGFAANRNGESTSQCATRTTLQHEIATGRSRGTVFGISKASDEAAEEFQHRIGQRNRAAGLRKG